MKGARLFLSVLFLTVLAACGENDGPVEVHFDRDSCELCRMIISDPKFTAQIQGPEGRMHKFDDIGNAIHWLKAMPFADDSTIKVWVADYESSTRDKVVWLDARKAFYQGGKISPMDYNYGAYPAKGGDMLDFTGMRQAVYDKGNSYWCDPAAYGYSKKVSEN